MLCFGIVWYICSTWQSLLRSSSKWRGKVQQYNRPSESNGIHIATFSRIGIYPQPKFGSSWYKIRKCSHYRAGDGESLVKWADFGLVKATNKRGEFEMSSDNGTKLYWAPVIRKIWENNTSRFWNIDSSKNVMTKMNDVFSSGIVFLEFCTNG